MAQRIKLFLINHGPLLTTITIFIVGYIISGQLYPTMQKPQVFFNLFINHAYLLLLAVGMTFVIISGGIDLSVAGVAALAGTGCAVLLRTGLSPYIVIPMMLLMGIALGFTMGSIIHFLNVEPFIVTLAGMFFARGVAFILSLQSVTINDPFFRFLGLTPIYIPFIPNAYVYIYSIIAVLIFFIAAYILFFTRFGRTVYALGNSAQSVRLMGLPVGRTKILVYCISGFCSAMGGIVFSIALTSGYGLYMQGNEMDTIASVVMGGTMLTGGVGNIFGTLFGVLIEGLIVSVLQFNGTLSSWWTRIGVGGLTLIFIGIQSLFYMRKPRQITGGKKLAEGEKAEGIVSPAVLARRKKAAAKNRLYWIFGGIGLVVIVAGAIIVGNVNRSNKSAAIQAVSSIPTRIPTPQHCALKPMRPDQVDSLVKDGAVIVMNRNGGDTCIDILYAIYPDGKIMIDDGTSKVNKQAATADVLKLTSDINDFGWYTDKFADTNHLPCGQCYSYAVSITYKDQIKNVHAVDGGTDASGDYWQSVALIDGLINRAASE
jgi:galactofuranose transport system permease protein